MTETARLTAPSSSEPNIGRSVVTGAAIGFASVAVGITAVGAIGGMQPGAALGLGMFIGIWGGAGFGCMLGGTIPLSRHLEAQASHGTHPRPEEPDRPAPR
jgi:hypothetical protein